MDGLINVETGQRSQMTPASLSERQGCDAEGARVMAKGNDPHRCSEGTMYAENIIGGY